MSTGDASQPPAEAEQTSIQMYGVKLKLKIKGW